MASKITYEVLDAQQHCQLKAYFCLHGEEGTKSDFEKLLVDVRKSFGARQSEKSDGNTLKTNSRRTSPYLVPPCARESRLFSMGTLMTIIDQSGSMDSRG